MVLALTEIKKPRLSKKNMRNRRSILMLNRIYKVSLKICPFPLILIIFNRFVFLIKIDL